MGFRTVIITKHCKVSYKAGKIVLQTDNDMQMIPLSDINILLLGTPQSVITGHAVMKLIENGVKLIFSDQKGIPVGEINGYGGHNQRNNHIKQQFKWPQYKRYLLWQKIIMNKILLQKNCLESFNLNTAGFDQLILDMEEGDNSNREAVAARMYFPRLFGQKFNRKDESDNVNAKLNFGYQVLLSAMAREIHISGYLTELGIHHDSLNNEWNLASDLMEPFRPLVDRIVKNNMTGDLDRNIKIQLVDCLNDEILFNGHQSIVTNAMHELVRVATQYLSNSQVEDIELEINL
ncbi:type II CRISPR-associated endonuclease Cas1 [Weissella paramesenteroides]|uniref:type II CRISPR-associated endonuclease Cas1 n=1 Tax=Weissella paramesenteroides TaxID=1249 RepID=UPI003F2732EE